MLKPLAAALVAVLLFARAGAADQQWSRVDTSNFIVIGTVGESSLRSIGTQFEGFREALTKLLSSSVTTTAVPTIARAEGLCVEADRARRAAVRSRRTLPGDGFRQGRLHQLSIGSAHQGDLRHPPAARSLCI
jgi:hypothetical protein